MHRDASCYARQMTEPRPILTVRTAPELRSRIERFAADTHRNLNDAANVLLERALVIWETDPYYAPERNQTYVPSQAPPPVVLSQESTA
jgi:hypothetical protein